MTTRFQRTETEDLAAARAMVSDAEREALERAEQLCQEAQELYEASRVAGQPELERARLQREQIVMIARAEAACLLNDAMAVINEDRVAANRARTEAEEELEFAKITRARAEEFLLEAKVKAVALRKAMDSATLDPATSAA